MDCEETAGQAVAWGRFGRCGRDVEGFAVRIAERAGSNILYGHFNNAVNLTIGRDAHDTSAIIPAIPKIAFAVNGGTIRKAARKTLKEGTFIADGPTGSVKVIGLNGVGECVSEI